MAISKPKVIICALFVICLSLSHARILKNNNPCKFYDVLMELGFSPSKIEKYKGLSANINRVSPGGPDPHHHNTPFAAQREAGMQYRSTIYK
ncbi:hypothetical protein DM860_009782 [Cuscuta australis]|uniref:Uncharacterized protein n=1 Tax=Cuscuta australis TaxID=267555 RepID=A0A328DCP7_9ASTE|nr:hypothetical protein DM860_009782 [Cuscuta australis]